MWFIGAPLTFAGDPDAVIPPSDAIAPTRPHDRHLTLVYLGHVPEDDVMAVWNALPPLTLPERVHALGWEQFGRRAFALTLADEGLLAAADACFDAAEPHVPDLRRPPRFRAHVTLGRVRKGSTPPSRPALRAWPVPAQPVDVGPPTLFRTSADTTGDRYEVMAQQGP